MKFLVQLFAICLEKLLQQKLLKILYIPAFEEIAPAVFAGAQRQQQLQIKRTAMDDLMTKYQLNDLTEPVQ